MRAKTSVLACTAMASLFTVMSFAPASAGNRGSLEDQMACTQDVYRYCSNFVPDEDAIVACLKKNVRGLSPGCHDVFTRPDSPAATHGDDD